MFGIFTSYGSIPPFLCSPFASFLVVVCQAASLWKLRESISEALSKEGYVYKYDVSLPVSQMYELVDKTRMRLQNSSAKVVGYGHLGDGNLHLNIVCPKADSAVLSLLEPWLFEELKVRALQLIMCLLVAPLSCFVLLSHTIIQTICT